VTRLSVAPHTARDQAEQVREELAQQQPAPSGKAYRVVEDGSRITVGERTTLKEALALKATKEGGSPVGGHNPDRYEFPEASGTGDADIRIVLDSALPVVRSLQKSGDSGDPTLTLWDLDVSREPDAG
jgi:hypothetical protein